MGNGTIGCRELLMLRLATLQLLLLLFASGSAFAQNSADGALALRSKYCDGYARDFAGSISRGQVIGGAAFGAIGGAIIGGIFGGGRGATRGAAIGGGTGTIAGGAQQSRDYAALYKQAYRDCIQRH
ncbi:MAG: hypothetical protein ACR2PI_13540 [Hyphomicrobiaceae bacterium]